MKALIKFWDGKLRDNFWLLDHTTRQMIQETIRVLRDTERKSRMPSAVRQAEEIRAAKK